MNLYMRTETHV